MRAPWPVPIPAPPIRPDLGPIGPEPALLAPAPKCDQCHERPGFGFHRVAKANEAWGEIKMLCAECSLSGRWAQIEVIWIRPPTTAVPPDFVDRPKGPPLTEAEKFDLLVQHKLADNARVKDEANRPMFWPLGTTLPWEVVLPEPQPEVIMSQGKPMLAPHVVERMARLEGRQKGKLALLRTIAQQAKANQGLPSRDPAPWRVTKWRTR